MVDDIAQLVDRIDPFGIAVWVYLCDDHRLARARQPWHGQSPLGEDHPLVAACGCHRHHLLVSLFSLDVFSMQAPIFELIAGFLVHNIPSIIMIVLLVFAWQRPAVGFVAFTIAAVSFALFFVRGVESLPNLLLFAFPILMVALLFHADWKWLNSQSST